MAAGQQAQPSTEDKVNTGVQMGGQIAEQFCPPAVATALAVALQIEPEVAHAIFAIAHLFHRRNSQKQQQK